MTHPTCPQAFLLSQTFHFFQLVDRLHMRFIIQHISGCTNILVDTLCKPDKIAPMEWMFHPKAFTLVCQRFSLPFIDLFATSENYQLRTYISRPSGLGGRCIQRSLDRPKRLCFSATCTTY